MLQTIEAVIDEQGDVRLLEPIHLPARRRAFVIILEYEPVISIPETALLSEPALAEDWNRPEEDKAMHRHWINNLFTMLSIEGVPIGAEMLQKMMGQADLVPNELSRAIVEAREE